MSGQAERPQFAPGSTRQSYDVIVIGGQLGGTVAGALLAKRGYRVLLVEHDGIGQGYEQQGWLLPYAPFVLPPLKASPVLEAALTELGLTTDVQRALAPHRPPLQLVMPKSRLDLAADGPRRKAELSRELGPRGPSLASALEAAAAAHSATDAFFLAPVPLPPSGLWESFGARRTALKHPALTAGPSLSGTDPATRLVSALAPFLSFTGKDEAKLSHSRTVSQVLTGPSHFPGGREGLRALLAKKIIDLGGEVLGHERGALPVVEGLTFEGHHVSGVKVVRSDSAFSAGCVVAATEAGALRRLIPQRKRQRKLLELLDLSTIKRFAFTVNWVVPEEVLPLGMGDLLLFDTEDEQVGPLLVQVLAPVGKEKAAHGARIVCAAALVPASARDLGEEHLRSLAQRIGGHLDGLMPFARPKALVESSPFLDASGVRGSRLMPHPLYEVEADPFLEITGLPARTPVKNLFLASREVVPGLGTEGEVLAGLQAARLVQERLKKHKPLSR